MATGRSTKLTGATGEFLVAAELCRRDLIATPFAGNVPHYDVIASGPGGGHVPVQVKAVNGNTWQFNIGSFLEVEFQAERQILGPKVQTPYPNLQVVLVALRNDARDHDRFFVLSWEQLRDLLADLHQRFLAKHGGQRPKAPRSLHVGLPIDAVLQFEDQWQVIEAALS
jgi:hypothetical protein